MKIKDKRKKIHLMNSFLSKGLKRGIGTALFSIGLFLLINAQSMTITGNVISDRIASVSSILGLIMIVGGMLLMINVKK